MIKIRKLMGIIALLLCIFMLPSCSTEPKSFSVEEFSITLDSGFKEIENDSAFAFFASSSHSVVCIKEDFSSLEKGDQTTIEEYGEVIKDKYPEYNAELINQGDYWYLEYENKAEHKNFYYNSYIFKTESAFYMVHFATGAKKDNSQSKQTFAAWAQTIQLKEMDG